MNKIEIKLIEEAKKLVSFSSCKECKYLNMVQGKPTCLFDSCTIEDCSLASEPLGE